jgi:hypothetical protein
MAVGSPACLVYDSSLLHDSPEDASILADGLPDTIDARSDVADEGADQHLTDTAADMSGEWLDRADVSHPEAESGTDTPPDEPAEAKPDVDLHACDPCKDPNLLRPVCPPSASDPASLPTPFAYAVRSLRIGLSPTADINEWRDLGYDQDCTQTGPGGLPSSCQTNGDAGAIIEDGHQGRDNSFGRNVGGRLALVRQSHPELPDIAGEANQRLETGAAGMLVGIDHYGGTDEDPTVSVAVYGSVGVANPPAAWDGSDAWKLDSSWLDSSDKPLHVDDSAYVSAGMVVARFDHLALLLTGDVGELDISIDRAVLVLALSPDRSMVTDGELFGVIGSQTLVQSIDRFVSQHGICPSDSSYAAMRTVMNRAADIRLADDVDAAAPCDSVSIGVSFLAQRAQLGSVAAPAQKAPDLCAGD